MQTYQTKRKSAPARTARSQAKPITADEMLHLSGAGAPQPMSPALREKFEPGFSADFSNIRISRGHIPEEMGVQAVARGTDILLDSSAGMDVLGHELAHVVQQAQGRVQGGYPVVENAALEHEADVMGARVASGLTAQAGPQNGFGGELTTIAPMSGASAPAQCKSKEEKEAEKAAKRVAKQQALAPTTPQTPAPAAQPMTPMQKLKANQQSYVPRIEKNTEHQRAYDALSIRNTANNPNKISQELEVALGMYVASSSPFNDPLRSGMSPEEMVAAGKAQKDMGLEDAGKQILAIDEHMKEHGTLDEDLDTFRGVDDRFLTFLLEQAGVKVKKFTDKKTGALDYKKLEKSGALKKLEGMTYEDKGYVSTTTNEYFANSWAMNTNLANRKRETGYNPSAYSPEVQAKVEKALVQDPSIMRGAHMLRMHNPAGTKGEFISKPGSSQNEFMLNRGQSYRITGMSPRAEGSYEFQVEVLGALEEAKKRKKGR